MNAKPRKTYLFFSLLLSLGVFLSFGPAWAENYPSELENIKKLEDTKKFEKHVSLRVKDVIGGIKALAITTPKQTALSQNAAPQALRNARVFSAPKIRTSIQAKPISASAAATRNNLSISVDRGRAFSTLSKAKERIENRVIRPRNDVQALPGPKSEVGIKTIPVTPRVMAPRPMRISLREPKATVAIQAKPVPRPTAATRNNININIGRDRAFSALSKAKERKERIENRVIRPRNDVQTLLRPKPEAEVKTVAATPKAIAPRPIKTGFSLMNAPRQDNEQGLGINKPVAVKAVSVAPLRPKNEIGVRASTRKAPALSPVKIEPVQVRATQTRMPNIKAVNAISHLRPSKNNNIAGNSFENNAGKSTVKTSVQPSTFGQIVHFKGTNQGFTQSTISSTRGLKLQNRPYVSNRLPVKRPDVPVAPSRQRQPMSLPAPVSVPSNTDNASGGSGGNSNNPTPSGSHSRHGSGFPAAAPLLLGLCGRLPTISRKSIGKNINEVSRRQKNGIGFILIPRGPNISEMNECSLAFVHRAQREVRVLNFRRVRHTLDERFQSFTLSKEEFIRSQKNCGLFYLVKNHGN